MRRIDATIGGTMGKLLTLYRTARFTSGILKGFSVQADLVRMDMTPEELIRRYGIGHKGTSLFTKDKYIITDASFQNYHRS